MQVFGIDFQKYWRSWHENDFTHHYFFTFTDLLGPGVLIQFDTSSHTLVKQNGMTLIKCSVSDFFVFENLVSKSMLTNLPMLQDLDISGISGWLTFEPYTGLLISTELKIERSSDVITHTK